MRPEVNLRAEFEPVDPSVEQPKVYIHLYMQTFFQPHFFQI